MQSSRKVCATNVYHHIYPPQPPYPLIIDTPPDLFLPIKKPPSPRRRSRFETTTALLPRLRRRRDFRESDTRRLDPRRIVVVRVALVLAMTEGALTTAFLCSSFAITSP